LFELEFHTYYLNTYAKYLVFAFLNSSITKTGISQSQRNVM